MSPSVGEKARGRLILAGVSQTFKVNHRASQMVCLISKGPPQLVRSPEPFSETLRDIWPQMIGNVQNISLLHHFQKPLKLSI
jgi:hypothetical protein